MELRWRLLQVITVSLAILGHTRAACPDGQFEYKNNCYLFSDSKQNWNTAREICATRGGVLTSITSRDEQNFLTRTAQQQRNQDDYWVGTTDAGTEGKWRNIDKQKFDVLWQKGQPDNHGKNENCGNLRRGFGYKHNDGTCGVSNRYICKRSAAYPDPCDFQNGWHYVNNKCYKSFKEKQNWPTARQKCQENDADLITINSAAEKSFISESVGCDNQQSMWLGFSDTNVAQTLGWVDNSKPDAKLLGWDTKNGEPDSTKYPKGANCGAVIAANKFLWVVNNCDDDERAFICEKDKGRCPSGWTTVGATCYKTMYAKTTWPEATAACQSYGGKMSTPDKSWVLSKAPGTLLNVLKRARTWIGISDSKSDDTFADLSSNLVDKAVWAPGFPASGATKGSMDCGYIQGTDKRARLQTCFQNYVYICEAAKGAVIAKPAPPSPDNLYCYPGWKKFSGKCYSFETKEKSFAAAKADCVNKQAALVSINNALEQSFISKNLLNTAWIGLSDLASPNTWKWADNSAATFTNWAKGEPNGKDEHCAEAVITYSGRWNDLPCSLLRDYICEKDAEPGSGPASPTPTRVWSPYCGQEWQYDQLSGNCYLFSTDLKDWNSASAECRKKKADLLSIESKYEQAYLQGVLNANPSFPLGFWTGANDRQSEAGWTWSDGKPFRYLNWGNGEPNNLREEDCVEIDKRTGTWNDNKCVDKKNYICKKTSTAPTTAGPITTPLPVVDKNCKVTELISGDHWIPDSAITVSNSRDTNSGPENSRIDWTVADTTIKISTKNEYKYKPAANLNLKGKTSLTFTVQACNDAHISLQPAVDEKITKDSYEIVIGGWGNTRSIIRKQHQGSAQGKPYTQSNIVDCNTPKPFWISWNNNQINVGTGTNVAGSTAFMSITDPNPYQVAGVAVSTGFGSSGVWVVNNPHGTRKGAWSPRYNVRAAAIGQEQYVYSTWIQANFYKPTLIQSVTTKGSASANEFVTEYSISYSYNEQETLQYLTQTGATTTKYFRGNTDQNTAVTNKFDSPFEAQIVRLYPRKFISFPSLRWSLSGCPSPSYCKAEKIITGKSSVPDRYIRGSSLKDSKYTDCRLTAIKPGDPIPKGWIANAPSPQTHSVPNEWLQFSFGQDMIVYGIITKGHAEQPYWVKTYQLQFRSRSQGFQFINYQEPYGVVKTFNGNKDQNTQVTNRLANPVIAYSVKIVPREYNTMIAMRVDVLGCLSGCSVAQLVNGPKPIDGKRLSASSQESSFTSAQRGRLYWKRNGNLVGGWVAKSQKVGQEFLQVDFGVLENIRAIATQGRQDAAQWVKTYRLAYSTDGKKFVNYYKPLAGSILPGNFDQNTIVKNFISIKAQALRVYPQSYQVKMAMRIELYGCQGSAPRHLGCYLDAPSASAFESSSYYSYNSPARCSETCFKYGYMYAGLRRSSCMCSSSLPAGGKSTNCNYRCTGDKRNFCGGYTSTTVSVYETGLGPDDERCADGYTEFQGRCYKLFSKRTGNQPVMWTEAQKACRSDGGDLATINTKAEQAYLTNQIRYARDNIWIGLNDLKHQMSFEWSDGSPVLATFWANGEPNNWLGKREDCVWANRFVSPPDKVAQNGKWFDVTCDSKAKAAYLCRKEKEKIKALPATAAPDVGCPQGWKAYESSCYLLIEHYSTWSGASGTCVKEGGTLARINDEFEQEFLTATLYAKKTTNTIRKTLYWTDLKTQRNTNAFIWSNNWDVIPYTHWDKNQPGPMPTATSRFPFFSFPRQYCVAMNGVKEDNTGYWIVQSCSTGAYPLCEKPRTGFTQPPLPTLSSTDIVCPSGWEGIGPNCYQFNIPSSAADRKSWTAAEKHCVDHGTHLAYINNGTENDYIWRNYLLNTAEYLVTESFWIGLNEKGSKTGYRWISGDPVSYTNWDDGEPNDWLGKEPCVYIKHNNGKWNDQICEQHNNWICSVSRVNAQKSIKQVTTTLAPTAGPPGSCPDGPEWKYFGKNCYYLSAETKTWRQASDFCNTKGAHLASIHSDIENSFIQSQAKVLFTNLEGRKRFDAGGFGQEVWIGLNELDRAKGHIWSDGKSYNYAKWQENEPNDWRGGEYCVGMAVVSGEWNDAHCSREYPFMCEKSKDQTSPIPPTIPPKISGYCPTGYYDFENDCYKIVVDKKVNWTTAEFNCETEGGHLAHVLNWREQTFLNSLLPLAKKAKVELWIGLDHVQSGGSKSVSFKWAANADISYTNWNTGEPNGQFKEPCTEMLYNPVGRWNDVSCSNDRGYICRKPKDGKINSTPAPDSSNCPNGYTLWNMACYKLTSTKGTWNYMDGNTCSADGAQLASVQDPYEQAYIQQILWKQNIQDDIWIGLHSKANLDYFAWSNQWPVIVTYWGKGEPTNFKSQEGCVVMKGGSLAGSGLWQHVACNEMHSAMCKKPLSPIPFPTPASGICPSAGNEKWLANSDGFCYLFWLDPRYTFNDASAACRATGGDLASVHSKDDTQFILKNIEHMDPVHGGLTKDVWIGLVKGENGGYSWTDRSAVYYANWASNEPNDVNNEEKCVELWAGQAEWNDQQCDVKRGFLCKIRQGVQPRAFPTPADPTPSSGPTTTRSPQQCQLAGWNYYNGSCYLVVTDSNALKHWGEAEKYCSMPGREAHLVSIGSEAENQWITENLLPKVESGTDAWLGFSERFRDNFFRWTDNSIVSYINWDDKQPSLNKGSQECTAMEINGLAPGAAGRWSTEYCYDKKAFICERDPTVDITATVSTIYTDGRDCVFPFTYRGQKFNNCTTYGANYLWCATTNHYDNDGQFAICDPYACPSGWSRNGKLCYYFSTQNDQRSWIESEKSCASMGADLAYIGDNSVQSFITNNIYEYYWMGLHDQNSDGLYQWDHKPGYYVRAGFTNWGIGEPRNTYGSEDCAQIVNGPYSDGRPGEWVMFNCAVERRYICMKPATFTLAASTTTTTTTPLTTTTTSSASATTLTTVSTTAETLNQTPGAVVSDNTAALRNGEIVAIVIAAVAVVVAIVAIFLYVRKVKPTVFGGKNSMSLENVTFTKEEGRVHVGLENPNFLSADE